MKTRDLFVLGIAAALAAGCVKKSQYEALQKRFDDTSAELATTQGQKKSLEEALAEAQAEAQALDRKLEGTRAELKKAEADIARLQAELAEVLKDKSALKASAARLTEALAELERRKAEADKRVAEFRDLLARFQKLIDAGKLRVEIKEGRMVLVLPTDILFDSGSAELSEDGQIAIAEVASILAEMSDRKFQVEGHTDSVPITKKFKSNWELASARALGVMEAMIAAGMPGSALSAASYGEFKPVAGNDTAEGRASNRRIDIVLVPDLSTLPGFSELSKAVSAQ